MKCALLEISSIRINGTDRPESTIVSNQEELDIEIEGTTTEPFEYDVIITFKNTSDVALASLAEGHYKGIISHMDIGSFRIKKQILLPKYLAKGDVMVDLVMHHPNVMYLLQCPHCALLHLDGSFGGFGSPLSLNHRGICGFESK